MRIDFGGFSAARGPAAPACWPRSRPPAAARSAGLSAEAGMGKSRLAAEVIGRALAMGFSGYGGYAVSYGTTTPYLAWETLQQGLALSERFRGDVYEGALIRTGLAEVLLEPDGDLDQAERWNREALDAGRDLIGQEGMGWHWHTRGRVLLRRGAFAEAQQAFAEAVRPPHVPPGTLPGRGQAPPLRNHFHPLRCPVKGMSYLNTSGRWTWVIESTT